MSLTNTDKIVAKRMDFVTYITSEDANGAATYFYVVVNGSKIEGFKKALQDGNFDPNIYGTVLESGYGLPSEELKKHMYDTYGCISDKSINLIDNL